MILRQGKSEGFMHYMCPFHILLFHVLLLTILSSVWNTSDLTTEVFQDGSISVTSNHLANFAILVSATKFPEVQT